MTNNSGKFNSNLYSHIATEPEAGKGSDTPLGAAKDPVVIDLPPMPEDTMSKVRRLLGEWWWLWLVAIVFYLSNRK